MPNARARWADAAADAAVADDADRRAVEVAEGDRAAVGPAALGDAGGRGAQPLDQMQDHRQGAFGDGVGAGAWRDDDGDATAGGLVDVDPFHADPGAGEHPQVRHPVEQSRVDERVGAHDRSGGIAEVVSAWIGHERRASRGRCPVTRSGSTCAQGHDDLGRRQRSSWCLTGPVRSSATTAPASRVVSEPMARNCQPVADIRAAAAPSGTSRPAALPCSSAAASTRSRAARYTGAVGLAGDAEGVATGPAGRRTARRRRRGRRSSSTASRPARVSICTTPRTSSLDAVERCGVQPVPAHAVVGGHAAVPVPAGSADAERGGRVVGGPSMRGNITPAAPRSSSRPARMRSVDSARTTVGTPYDAAAGTTSRACSSPPAPCSRSSSTQSTPAAAHTSAVTGVAAPRNVP